MLFAAKKFSQTFKMPRAPISILNFAEPSCGTIVLLMGCVCYWQVTPLLATLWQWQKRSQIVVFLHMKRWSNTRQRSFWIFKDYTFGWNHKYKTTSLLKHIHLHKLSSNKFCFFCWFFFSFVFNWNDFNSLLLFVVVCL